MKTRMELSCVEENLIDSLFEVHTILMATETVSAELKVFHDVNRDPVLGLSWITVTNKSNPMELAQIYELKKKVFELSEALKKEREKAQ